MAEVKKVPNPIDVHVGSRVRMKRIIKGLSQEKLGSTLGVTFQQIQKYEKGTNRIGASRLKNISHILDAPISFFFEGTDNTTNSDFQTQGMNEPSSDNYVVDFVSSSEGLQLNKSFMKIKNPKIRKKIIDLVKSINDEA